MALLIYRYCYVELLICATLAAVIRVTVGPWGIYKSVTQIPFRPPGSRGVLPPVFSALKNYYYIPRLVYDRALLYELREISITV